MGLLIDREKTMQWLETCVSGCEEGCPYEYKNLVYRVECKADLMRDALDLLKEQEAEAKWIYGEDKTGVDGWHCSECNFFEPWFYKFTADIDFIRFYGHCPNCGRKMTSYTGKPTQKEDEA